MQNEPVTYQIDLRWSLWSDSVAELEESNPQAFKDARNAFLGAHGPVLIKTSPKKEIRWGRVLFTKGEATVTFRFDWDEPSDQVSRIEIEPELTDAERDYAVNRIDDYLSEMDWTCEDTVTAPTFEELMVEIDKVESDLINLEEDEGCSFDRFLDELKTAIVDERAQ